MRVVRRLHRIWRGGCVFAAVILIVACQSMSSNDPAKISFKIPPGSRLVLNKELAIPAGRAHVVMQDGEPGPAADEWNVNCVFEVRNLGPRVIQPDTFLISRWSSQRDWVNEPNTMRFYKVFHLKSDRQADILPMTCQYWSYPLVGRPVTIRQVQEALGTYFTFEFAQ